MESHDALKMAIGENARMTAKRLGRSLSLVYKWCEPSNDFTDCGALNPLDRIETVIETSIKLGREPKESFAPIFYLAACFGGMFLPPVPRTFENNEYSKQLCRSIKEAGEAFAVAGDALEDGELSPNKRKLILKELYEAIAELSTFASMVEEAK